MYNVDFKKLVLWVTPLWLRKSNILIMVFAFTLPVRKLYNIFLEFVAAKIYRLTHNGQVCYLQKVLNDAFDIFLKRIYIGNFVGLNRIYFWPEADRRDVDFSESVFFWADSFYADSGVDFVVHIPVDVATTEPQLSYMRSLLNEYKLAGKNYNIVRI